MDTGTILSTLQTAQFTRSLKPEHLERLAGMAFEMTFCKDEVLYREGDLGDVLYIIKEGQIAVEVHIRGKGRKTIFTVGPGQLLGWSAFYPQKRKNASSRAISAGTAIAISAPQLRQACQEDHEFGYEIVWRISEVIADRLKATRLQLMDIFAPRK